MMQERNIEALELCLCGTCARTYYNMRSRRIVRKDPYQVTKDSCDCCCVRMGFDYLITPLSNVQNRRFNRLRTLESEAANG